MPGQATEAYFIVNSASFFVGWMWFVVASDLVTLVGLALRQGLAALASSATAHSNALVEHDDKTQLLAVALGCPAFTYGVVRLQMVLYARTEPPKNGPSARHAAQKREMIAERDRMRLELRARADWRRLWAVQQMTTTLRQTDSVRKGRWATSTFASRANQHEMQ